MTTEAERLQNQGTGPVPLWYKWGPYVAERSWGTVREDYSPLGDVWTSFDFAVAHERAYRWGEDGIAGFCDRYQTLVMAPCFWNGKDPILKERLFGLSSPQGNHGEDVKECYYHIDALPSHAYMKYLYRYPHKCFPYEELLKENAKRTTKDPEYELIDTGIFAEEAYFDILIEYAKGDPEDISMKVTIHNRAKQEAHLDLLLQVWFRNQWSWTPDKEQRPKIYLGQDAMKQICFIADDAELAPLDNLPFAYKLGKRYFYASDNAAFLFTENDSKVEGDSRCKDAFHEKIVHQKERPPILSGTKAAFHYACLIKAESIETFYLRCTDAPVLQPLQSIEELFRMRKEEADAFYATIHPEKASLEEREIQRQALSGMIWNKQIYLYDVEKWLSGDDPAHPLSSSRYSIRNAHWKHLNSMRIFAMPDKWEYPWFAAWDQAFHAVIWSLLDMSFAKEQLWLLLFDQFQHPNGQIPAYEWEFSDLNPPLQGWACLHIFIREKEKTGKEDFEFLERCFHKLLMNFSWWVNKIDSSGNNIFEGGFLGFDNITVLDRSKPVAEGVTLQQSDGTGWMAFFCLNLMKIALELAKKNRVYESLATKFFEHYVYIAQSMAKRGIKSIEIWDPEDGFFYDVLRHENGEFSRFHLRSLVGIIPLFAVEFLRAQDLEAYPSFASNFFWFLKNRKDLVLQCVMTVPREQETYYVLSPLNRKQLESILGYIWNPEEFRSPYGLRSLSKYHEKHPFVFWDKSVSYEPAESLDRVKGGNSNWRGPVWMPLNYLLIESLEKFAIVLQQEVVVQAEKELPVCLKTMAQSFAQRVLHLFLKDEDGHVPCLGKDFPFTKDSSWTKNYLFYEYFNPETGKGLGASHQSGWTSLIANIIDFLYKN